MVLMLSSSPPLFATPASVRGASPSLALFLQHPRHALCPASIVIDVALDIGVRASVRLIGAQRQSRPARAIVVPARNLKTTVDL